MGRLVGLWDFAAATFLATPSCDGGLQMSGQLSWSAFCNDRLAATLSIGGNFSQQCFKSLNMIHTR